ncbi:hypothetical protein [Pseudoxanthomonas dokdonensis]|uniref:Uncharacterized protein n=1 Tax=Pseudoxanthomonas dokdonensis TaxID=344882 RepID=A0A0R0CCH7_9GAMM|nr:hypothetical protein [Pseudoxanthomonas dokdonensis]KRG67357.1 hypothetical protein ABB29_15615 [Pseudoxanthomonas dokdonensis]
MSPPIHGAPDHGAPLPLDRQARGLHQQALQSLSPQVLAQLRAARTQAQRASVHASPAWQRRWLPAAATALSLALASVIGLHYFGSEPAPTPSTPVAVSSEAVEASLSAATEYRDTSAVLDENPDLYLWLASTDVPSLAME